MLFWCEYAKNLFVNDGKAMDKVGNGNEHRNKSKFLGGIFGGNPNLSFIV